MIDVIAVILMVAAIPLLLFGIVFLVSSLVVFCGILINWNEEKILGKDERPLEERVMEALRNEN